jgi:hypothetical protein
VSEGGGTDAGRGRRGRQLLLVFLGGLGLGAAGVGAYSWTAGAGDLAARPGAAGAAGLAHPMLLGPLLASLAAEPSQASGLTTSTQDGDFLFLTNRRTIWVIHRKEGRFANYHFRDDEARTVERSRVVSLDQETFPPQDTVYLLSDRNLTEVLWVCNKRTGDVQLWEPRHDRSVVADRPIATYIDLLR